MFELELEGLSNEDREFEVARRFVRFASDATRRASSAAAAGASPKAAVGNALKQAAYNHAPGLLRKRRGGGRNGRPGGRTAIGQKEWPPLPDDQIFLYGSHMPIGFP